MAKGTDADLSPLAALSAEALQSSLATVASAVGGAAMTFTPRRMPPGRRVGDDDNDEDADSDDDAGGGGAQNECVGTPFMLHSAHLAHTHGRPFVSKCVERSLNTTARLPQGWPSLRQLVGTLATHNTYTAVVWLARDVVALDCLTNYRGHYAPLCLCFIGVTRCVWVLISTLADLAD
jgi:hypothetical protein